MEKNVYLRFYPADYTTASGREYLSVYNVQIGVAEDIRYNAIIKLLDGEEYGNNKKSESKY